MIFVMSTLAQRSILASNHEYAVRQAHRVVRGARTIAMDIRHGLGRATRSNKLLNKTSKTQRTDVRQYFVGYLSGVFFSSFLSSFLLSLLLLP